MTAVTIMYIADRLQYDMTVMTRTMVSAKAV